MVLPLNSQRPPRQPDNTGPAMIIALAIVLAAIIQSIVTVVAANRVGGMF
jgi:hypothetical protein